MPARQRSQQIRLKQLMLHDPTAGRHIETADGGYCSFKFHIKTGNCKTQIKTFQFYRENRSKLQQN